jgi:hypothetical protein
MAVARSAVRFSGEAGAVSIRAGALFDEVIVTEPFLHGR